MTSVLANAFIVYIIVVTCILKQGNFDNSKTRSCRAFRCRCKVKANVFDAAPSHDFGLISLDPDFNNNQFGVGNSTEPTSEIGAKLLSYDCLTLRQLCKSACAERLDLSVHYSRFTPLGLMLCKQMEKPTPHNTLVFSSAKLQATACSRHHHGNDVALRQVKGRSPLCCGYTEVINDDGTLSDKFGWNPDCRAQVYYLT